MTATKADLRGSGLYNLACLLAMLAGLLLFAAAVAAEGAK
jgi:hypothetical protein